MTEIKAQLEKWAEDRGKAVQPPWELAGQDRNTFLSEFTEDVQRLSGALSGEVWEGLEKATVAERMIQALQLLHWTLAKRDATQMMSLGARLGVQLRQLEHNTATRRLAHGGSSGIHTLGQD